MSDVKRYRCYYTNDFNDDYEAFSEESDDGEWVKSSDYDSLRHELDQLRDLLISARTAVEVCHDISPMIFPGARALVARIDALIKPTTERSDKP
jgi:hypothetical protein